MQTSIILHAQEVPEHVRLGHNAMVVVQKRFRQLGVDIEDPLTDPRLQWFIHKSDKAVKIVFSDACTTGGLMDNT